MRFAQDTDSMFTPTKVFSAHLPFGALDSCSCFESALINSSSVMFAEADTGSVQGVHYDYCHCTWCGRKNTRIFCSPQSAIKIFESFSLNDKF